MRFFPKSANFYVFFESMAQNIVDAAKLLNEMVGNPVRIIELADQIKNLEHQADETVHGVMNLLDTVFITPFDREDIHVLVSRLDDVIDHIDGAAKHMVLYEVKTLPEGMTPLAALLEKACMAVHTAVHKFKDLKRTTATIAAVIEINRIEDEGDAAMRAGMGRLFKDGLDALDVIKLKDIYEDIENAIDRCEDVANVIEGVILKNA
jgi:predicted phosphate transport protein (TIGR00153 family)